MKSRLTLCASIFYFFNIQAEQIDFTHCKPQQINITFNANTDAGLEQDNTINQKAEHTSKPDTNIHSSQQNPDNGPSKNLEPTVSAENYIIRNTAKTYCVYLIAGSAGLALSPLLFPIYCTNRFIIYPLLSDSPWFDHPTPEESAKLAEQGKKKVVEPIFFPLCYEIHKHLTTTYLPKK